MLKTFINSTHEGYAIRAYEYALSDSASLSALAASGDTRMLSDLPQLLERTTEHSAYVLDQGYQASFTVPLIYQTQFLGFLFFDSTKPDTFTPALQRELLLYSHVIMLALASQLIAINSIIGSVQVAREFAELRDLETGAHLQRMARFSRLIAHHLVEPLNLTDEFVENVFLYAPMHDIGKIGIPDRVLLKPGKLNVEEWAIMKTHPLKGREMVDAITENLGLSHVPASSVMRNIVEFHHEALDGSGYPYGLRGADIPLEARIVSVADIFDALTSERPYKRAWSTDEAVTELVSMVDAGKIDADCVAALSEHVDEFDTVRQQFAEQSS